MPRPRQRQGTVFCDCFDCLDRPAAVCGTLHELAACAAVARQDPPPKALLIYGSGFLRQAGGGTPNLDEGSFPHLDRVAREGNLGLLAVARAHVAAAHGPPQSPCAPSTAELADVLGVRQEECQQNAAEGSSSTIASLAARFRGLSSLFASTSAEAMQLAQAAGMQLDPSLRLASGPPGAPADERSAQALPSAAATADAVIAGLGLGISNDGANLVMLHLDVADLAATATANAGDTTGAPVSARENGSSGGDSEEAAAVGEQVEREQRLQEAALEGLEWLDSLVKHLMAHPGVRERTLLALMLSSQGRPVTAADAAAGGAAGKAGAPDGGNVQVQDAMRPGGATIDPGASVVTPHSGMMAMMAPASGSAAAFGALDKVPCPLVERPLQSFQKLGQERVQVQLCAPILVAQRLPGVVRRDRSERLALQECHVRCGQGCIPASRFLHEVACKMGHASAGGA